MSETDVLDGVALSLQAGTAVYALRLNRLFGVERTGWPLFGLFVIMLVARLGDAFQWQLPPPGLDLQTVQLVVSILLLIGVAHLSLLWRQHAQAERTVLYTENEVRDAVFERTQALALARAQLEVELDALKRAGAHHRGENLAAVGRLAGGIAHHFNNLLAIIQGVVSLRLSSDTRPSADSDAFQQIQLASDRAAQLTRDLLAFGERTVTHPQVVDLNNLIERSVAPLRRLLGDQIILRAQTRALPILVNADPDVIQRILSKLAMHAREAMPAGGHWTIQTSRVSRSGRQDSPEPDLPPGRYGCITLTDDGCGLPPDVLERLFEPFPTADYLLRESGLGMAAAFGLVRQHGGMIRVSSALARGTTFEVYLPEIGT